jgi:hypothetical protein
LRSITRFISISRRSFALSLRKTGDSTKSPIWLSIRPTYHLEQVRLNWIWQSRRLGSRLHRRRSPLTKETPINPRRRRRPIWSSPPRPTSAAYHHGGWCLALPWHRGRTRTGCPRPSRVVTARTVCQDNPCRREQNRIAAPAMTIPAAGLVKLRVEPLLQLRNQVLYQPRGFIIPYPPRQRFVSADLFFEPLRFVFLFHGES